VQDNAKTSNESLWKKREVCQKLAFSLRTLDSRIADGTIPFVKIGGAVRFVPDDINRLIKSRRVGGAK
jgi:excisionase family DNA binding protein